MRARAGDPHHSAADATEWIADATRELAGLTKRTSPQGADGPSDADLPALEQLRAAIAQLISTLPRPIRLVSTSKPGIAISHLALRKILTWALAELAAEASAAVADIAVDLHDATLAAVHIDLVAVGAEERDRTYLEDGDALRAHAASTIAKTLGVPAPPITLTWDDLIEIDDPRPL